MKLLLIHAFPMDSSMWDGQAKRLREQALRVDLPGFGGAPGVGPVMTMRAAAERCVSALDEAGEERAVVCGLSMGGYVALEMWRIRPERIAGLVFTNTRAEADDEAAKYRRLALAERLDEEGIAFLVSEPPPLLSANAPSELWSAVKATIVAQPAGAIAAASRGMAERPDSTPDLPQITVPTLVVTSSGDTLIPAWITARMAERIPGAELATITDAGHLSNMEAPGEFTALLADHLERCRMCA